MLHVTYDPPLGVLRLNDPKHRNALNPKMVQSLAHHVQQWEEDPAIRVILLGTHDPKAFSAGVDLNFMGHADPEAFKAHDTLSGEWRILETLSKPVITVIEGYCLGGGLELALMADIMLLSQDAVLGFPEVKLGLMPGLGGTQRLARCVGVQRAALWTLSGQMFTAAESYEMGLGSRVLPPQSLWVEAEALAHTLASYDQDALGCIKKALRASQDQPLSEGMKRETNLFYSLLKTPQAQETLKKFLKR